VRVNVKGISGSGKTTFSRELAERLGVPYLELDAIHHGPNWTEASADELRARVREFMAGAPDGWVIDGNYESKLGGLVLDAADEIVWLDPPLRLALHPRRRRAVERQPRELARRLLGAGVAVRLDAAVLGQAPPSVAAQVRR
jgi:adenylate kinase family enzyme